jgi:hypothetical protein
MQRTAEEGAMDEAGMAFDAWLRGNLAEKFGDAVQEPIPAELRAILGEQD